MLNVIIRVTYFWFRYKYTNVQYASTNNMQLTRTYWNKNVACFYQYHKHSYRWYFLYEINFQILWNWNWHQWITYVLIVGKNCTQSIDEYLVHWLSYLWLTSTEQVISYILDEGKLLHQNECRLKDDTGSQKVKFHIQ